MVRDEEDAEEQEAKLIKILRNLIGDPEFIRLPTQKAMKAYALEIHPELQDLEESVIRDEIQVLDGKIEAKGLRKRLKRT
ncbi:MAG: hypothetical protein ACRESE_07215 [Gammaproteobacteria bacterium]